ncbi:hypothetical protein Avbf_16947 [Armadillidium vulgare]|nr:hypothetical protein Avbf_16947 [Armadillidium vulgare]
MVRTENALVNLTSPGTLETINATEGDNINIACYAVESMYYYASFNYSGKTNRCNTKLSSGRCLNITNISLSKDWFFECIAQTRITKINEKISFRIMYSAASHRNGMMTINEMENSVYVVLKVYDQKIISKVFKIKKIAPWILSSSKVSLEGTEIKVKEHFPFFIACYVEGRPKPKITWLKDGENIEEIIENNDEESNWVLEPLEECCWLK